VLLTGESESAAEQALLEKHAAVLRAEIIVVPHHGSDTSSTTALIAAAEPQLAIISAGFGNRYGLPDQAVIDRYQDQAIRVINTAAAGAVTVEIGRAGIAVATERARRNHFWTSRNGDL